jgi:hypothetical protein
VLAIKHMYCRCLNFLEPRHTLHPWLLLSCRLPILYTLSSWLELSASSLLSSLLWSGQQATCTICLIGSHCDLPYIGPTSCPVDYYTPLWLPSNKLLNLPHGLRVFGSQR